MSRMEPVVLCLDYPKDYGKTYGMNRLYAGVHWAQRKQAAAFWHTAVQAALRRQGIRRKPFECPVIITFAWNDRLDLSNEAWAAKMIEDGLKGWVITDDSRKYVHEIRHTTHGRKCIVVVVEPEEAK